MNDGLSSFVTNLRRLLNDPRDISPRLVEELLGLPNATISEAIGESFQAKKAMPSGAPVALDILYTTQKTQKKIDSVYIYPCSKDVSALDGMADTIATVFGRKDAVPSKNNKGCAMTYGADGQSGRVIHFLFDKPSHRSSRTDLMFSGILVDNIN